MTSAVTLFPENASFALSLGQLIATLDIDTSLGQLIATLDIDTSRYHSPPR